MTYLEQLYADLERTDDPKEISAILSFIELEEKANDHAEPYLQDDLNRLVDDGILDESWRL